MADTIVISADNTFQIGYSGSAIQAKLGAITVGAEKTEIINLKITSDQITNNIPGGKIADHSIDALQIKEDAILTDAIKDGSITEDKLHSECISTEKIKPNQITDSLIQQGGLDTQSIKDRAITADKIKLGCIVGDNIAKNTITNNNLAVDCIDTSNIIDGAIETDKIKDGHITNDKLAGSISNDKLENNSITLKIGNSSSEVLSLGSTLSYRLSTATNLINGNGTNTIVQTGADTSLSSTNFNNTAVFGIETMATANNQFIIGRFNNNNVDTTKNSSFIVGYGASATDRYNIFEVGKVGPVDVLYGLKLFDNSNDHTAMSQIFTVGGELYVNSCKVHLYKEDKLQIPAGYSAFTDSAFIAYNSLVTGGLAPDTAKNYSKLTNNELIIHGDAVNSKQSSITISDVGGNTAIIKQKTTTGKATTTFMLPDNSGIITTDTWIKAKLTNKIYNYSLDADGTVLTITKEDVSLWQ